MQAAAAGVRHVGFNGGDLQVLHEGFRGFPAALHAEGNHAAGTVGQVLLCPRVVFVSRKAAVGDPGDLFMTGQELGHSLSVLAVALHAHMQAFQAQAQQEGVLGALDGTEVPHQLGGCLGDEGAAEAELLRIGYAVIAFIRRGETGELVRVLFPVEFTAVHDGAAYTAAVAVHVLGGGVGHDIRAPFNGTAVDRGGEGVVDDQRDAVGMGGFRELLNVQDAQGRVGDGFAEEGLGVGAESGVQLFIGAVRADEGEVDAHLFHRDGEEVVGAAVDGGTGHHVVARVGDVEDGIEVGCLAGRGQHGRGAAFQGADAGRHRVVGGVLQAGIEITGGFQVKELAHILTGIIFEGGGLDNRDLAGLTVLRCITALYAKGFNSGH